MGGVDGPKSTCFVRGCFDQFPKFRVFLQGLVFAHLDAGAEEEILQRMPAQNAMHEHAELVALKINPVIANPETVQRVAVTFEFAKIFQFAGNDVLGQTAKITEDLELQFLGHPREFGRRRRREDDLKGIHHN